MQNYVTHTPLSGAENIATTKKKENTQNRNKWTKTAFHTVAKRQAYFQYFHCHAAFYIDIRHRQYARARHMQIVCTHKDKNENEKEKEHGNGNGKNENENENESDTMNSNSE